MTKKRKMVKARKKDVGSIVKVHWDDCPERNSLLVEAEPDNKRFVQVFDFETNILQTVHRTQIVEVDVNIAEFLGIKIEA